MLDRSTSYRSSFVAALATFAMAGCSGGGGGDPAPGGTPDSGTNPPAQTPAPSTPPPILPPVTQAWHVPTCTSVSGGAPVTFTSDGGFHRAPVEMPAAPNYFTYGVVALSGGSTLAALVGTTTHDDSAEIVFSTDAGCSWQPSGQTVPHVYYHLSAEMSAASGYAYVWGSGGNQVVYVIEPTGIAKPFSLEFDPWVAGPFGLGIDPNDPTRIRISIYDCMHRASCGYGAQIMETTDEGATWTQVGERMPYLALNARFSPTNLDHIVLPGIVPARVTLDGGSQWLTSDGVPKDWTPDEAAIGPDGQTVWLIVHTSLNGSIVRAMYVSHDGGVNYQEAFASSDENPFPWDGAEGEPLNQVRIFPHPVVPDIVYFSYTSHSTATSYLYRYDAELDQLTKRSWPAAEGAVWSLAFNPADPDVLYLGLAAAE